MESYWEDITPEKAAAYLDGNAAGRKLSESTVSDYARDMAAGRWLPSPQGIILDGDGVMVDGQHRMAAIIRAGVTVQIWVTRGADRASFVVLDGQRPRRPRDRFYMEGHRKHSTQLAAVARRAVLWQMGKPWTRTSTPTWGEIEKIVADQPSLIEAARFAHAWPGRRTIPPTLAGFCWYLFHNIDADAAEYFMERLRDGDGLKRGDPILTLREKLGTNRAHVRTAWMRPEVNLAYVIVAWNHFRKHESRLIIRIPPVLADDSFPEPL